MTKLVNPFEGSYVKPSKKLNVLDRMQDIAWQWIPPSKPKEEVISCYIKHGINLVPVTYNTATRICSPLEI
jgi:hypothetical protein